MDGGGGPPLSDETSGSFLSSESATKPSEVIAPEMFSNSFTCWSKYRSNGYSTMRARVLFSWSLYRSRKMVEMLSRSLSIQPRCSSDWYTACSRSQPWVRIVRENGNFQRTTKIRLKSLALFHFSVYFSFL